MDQEVILLNFKIIVIISISLAFLLAFFLLKEKRTLGGIIRQTNRRKDNPAPVINPPTQRKPLKYLSLAFINFKRFLTAIVRSGKWENLQLLVKLSLAVISIRLVIFLIAYMGIIITNNSKLPADATFFNSIEQVWNVWDSPHYIDIARDWYQREGEARFFIVFYPLYPFLVHLVNYLVNNYFFSGVIVSNFCLVLGCFYLYKLVRKLYGEKAAKGSVKFLLIFPFSFFFGIVYTESLFLTLSIMVFYYAAKRDWALTGIIGMLAALTRIQGVLLLLPVLYEYIQASQFKDKILNQGTKATTLYLLKTAGFFLLIPLGVFIYLLINKVSTGDWFMFLEYQKINWGQKMGFFAENLKTHLSYALEDKSGARMGIWIPHLVSFASVTFLTFYSFKVMRLSYTIYMLAYTLLSYSPTWLLSGSRYISALFPIYILIALLSRKSLVDKAITFIFTLLLCFYTIALHLTPFVM
jgi:Gpi18-like mannosyltransferase